MAPTDLRSRIPRPVLFMVAGAVGNFFFFYLSQIVYALNTCEWQRASVSWTLSYFISIWLQHALNALIVFGMPEKYWRGLGATYATYSITLGLSPLVNAAIIASIPNCTPTTAWWGTLGATGCINYLTVSSAMEDKREA
ncbi:unnamed protein product [Phaeothamnion confervicola]